MNNVPLLIDIGALSCDCSDHVLDEMHKALHDDDKGNDIWRPHESHFIRDLIEKWTGTGVARLESVHTGLLNWVKGVFHKPGKRVPKPTTPFARWDNSELTRVRIYLETTPPDLFDLDDWMMVSDYLVQRYLPAEAVMEDAKWQVNRAAMMGRVEANLPEIKAAAIANLHDKLVRDATVLKREVGMSREQAAAIEFGQARCCQYVTNVTESTRAVIKQSIINWQQEKFNGVPKSVGERDLQGRLLDSFATLNRDWRRIALTEVADNAMNGFIAAQPDGVKVKRQEMYQGACPMCSKVDGKVLTVVPADKPNKNWDTEVWVGKSNYGRSASPYRRVGGQLVQRTDSELSKIAAGTLHPNCRGRWVAVDEPKLGVDPKFAAWLNANMKAMPD